MFLSEKADTFSLSVVYVLMLFFSYEVFNDPLNSVPLSTQTFCGCFVFIICLNASAVEVAHFDFNGSTHRKRDMQSTATIRYLMFLLYSQNYQHTLLSSNFNYQQIMTIFRLSHKLSL